MLICNSLECWSDTSQIEVRQKHNLQVYGAMLLSGWQAKIAFSILFILFFPFISMAENELSSYKLKCGGDKTEFGYAKSVYFNNKAYKFTRYSDDAWMKGTKGDYIGCVRYDTDKSGKLTKANRMKWVAASNTTKDDELSGQSVTACVFNGRIYVFYDYINPKKYEERFIYYKSSNDPETIGFEPAGGYKIESILPITTGFGPGTPALRVTAAVLNNKLYVFYTHIKWDKVAWAVFDGKTWSEGQPLSQMKFSSLDSQAALTDAGTSIIAIAGAVDNSVRMICFDGEKFHISENYADIHGMDSNYIRIAQGSVSNGAQANCLQLFVGESYPTGLGVVNGVINRFEYSLSGDQGNQGKFASAVSALSYSGSKGIYWGVVTAFRSDEKSNLLQYISLVAPSSDIAGTYTSDYFKFLQSHKVDTAQKDITTDKDTLPSAWTILGVIEGVPPFCLNGITPAGPTSYVEYGESKGKEISTSQSYEASFSVGIGGKGKSISGGIEFSQGFKNIHNWSEKIETKFNIGMKNTGDNRLGDYGYLIISKPTLVINNYERYASKQSNKLNNVNFIYVTDVSVESMPYELEKPYSGMTKRPKSSDYSNWYNHTVPEDQIIEKINKIVGDTRGSDSSSSIAITKSESIGGESSSKVKVEAGFFDIFKVSSSFSFTLSNTTSTNLSKNITVSLSLPTPPSGSGRYLNRIEVKPFWLKSDDKSKASWVPNDYEWNKPWCLTWSVLSWDFSKKGTTMDTNGDGYQDVMSKKQSTSPQSSLKGGHYQYGTAYIILPEKNKFAIENEDLYISDGSILLCTADFDSDGGTDILWYNKEQSRLAVQLVDFDGDKKLQDVTGINIDDVHQPVEAGDFQRTASATEVLVRDSTTGSIILYSVDASFNANWAETIFSPGDSSIEYVGKGDFDGNDCYDVLVYDPSRYTYKIIFLQERTETERLVMKVADINPLMTTKKGAVSTQDLTFLGVCDFNGDAKSDIIYKNDKGQLFIALMDGESVTKSDFIKAKITKGLSLVTLGDFNNDLCADLLFQRSSSKRNKLMIYYLKPPKNPAKSPDPVKCIGKKTLDLGDQFNDSPDNTIYPSLD